MTQLAENSEEQTPAGYSENGSESGASDEREDDAAAAHEHCSAHGSARGDSPGDDRMRQLLGENEMLRGHVDRLLHRFEQLSDQFAQHDVNRPPVYPPHPPHPPEPACASARGTPLATPSVLAGSTPIPPPSVGYLDF